MQENEEIDDEEKKAEDEVKKGRTCNLQGNLYGEKMKEIKNAGKKRREVVCENLYKGILPKENSS